MSKPHNFASNDMETGSSINSCMEVSRMISLMINLPSTIFDGIVLVLSPAQKIFTEYEIKIGIKFKTMKCHNGMFWNAMKHNPACLP
uniref:Uncharacterized protein n=1 Tax=Romanomermis culicivorax TaxID=13658 RepID=A0A915IZV3_ROMCU